MKAAINQLMGLQQKIESCLRPMRCRICAYDAIPEAQHAPIRECDSIKASGRVCTSILSKMVAPSLVTVTSPSGLTMILSMPLGPKDERSESATAFAAVMLAYGYTTLQAGAICQGKPKEENIKC